MNGKDIRNILQKERLFQWELAEELKISEFTLSRWLRGENPQEREKAILEAIEQLTTKE